MSRSKVYLVFFLMLAASMSFNGCSAPNEESPINPDTGKHAAGWLPAGHRNAAVSGTQSCTTCHGADLSGGIAGISCTSCHLGSPTSVHPADWASILNTHGPYVKANTTSACANQYCHGLSLTGVAGSGPSCTSCHLGGPTSGHPADWVPVYSTHGPYVLANGTTACSNQACHGPVLAGVENSGPSCTACHLGGTTSVHPQDWVPVYSKHSPYVVAHGTAACSNQYCHGSSLTGVEASGPSCTSCHMGGVTSIHPWAEDTCSSHGNYAYTNGTAGCANAACHGTDLQGVQDSGPSCTKCHSTIPDSNQCDYCHGRPPDGTGYPNAAGKHAEHMQIAGVTCDTCHSRSCEQHANGVVDVVFSAAGPASASGKPAPAFDATAKTCSNIACHMVPAGTFSYSIQDGSGGTGFYTVNVYGSSGATPSWYSSGAGCTACHQDPPRNGTDGSNIWHSGQHGGGNQCQLCHPDASSPGNGIGDTITNALQHRDGLYTLQPQFESQCFYCH